MNNSNRTESGIEMELQFKHKSCLRRDKRMKQNESLANKVYTYVFNETGPHQESEKKSWSREITIFGTQKRFRQGKCEYVDEL